jgi:hypothetical protein
MTDIMTFQNTGNSWDTLYSIETKNVIKQHIKNNTFSAIQTIHGVLSSTSASWSIRDAFTLGMKGGLSWGFPRRSYFIERNVCIIPWNTSLRFPFISLPIPRYRMPAMLSGWYKIQLNETRTIVRSSEVLMWHEAWGQNWRQIVTLLWPCRMCCAIRT